MLFQAVAVYRGAICRTMKATTTILIEVLATFRTYGEDLGLIYSFSLRAGHLPLLEPLKSWRTGGCEVHFRSIRAAVVKMSSPFVLDLQSSQLIKICWSSGADQVVFSLSCLVSDSSIRHIYLLPRCWED